MHENFDRIETIHFQGFHQRVRSPPSTGLFGLQAISRIAALPRTKCFCLKRLHNHEYLKTKTGYYQYSWILRSSKYTKML